MTAVRAFCIRMRCNLSAVSSWKTYLTVPGRRSGNDSVLFRHCPHSKIAPLDIKLKGLRSRAHEGLSCPSFIHFQATDTLRGSRPLGASATATLSLAEDNSGEVQSPGLPLIRQRVASASCPPVANLPKFHNESGSASSVTL